MEFIPADYFRRFTLDEVFPHPERPFEVDVGCGDGKFLLEMAAQFPERNFLGIERLGGRVAKICRKVARRGLSNVRVLRLESSYALGWLLPLESATRLHLLFPDPWPKKRHAHHRFVQPDNLGAIHQALKPEGEFLFKTDHEPYFIEATEVLDGSPLFTRIDWLEAEEFYPQTDFEGIWLREGKTIGAARYRKRAKA
jgi:tRNA (guanine-N7-)-methyltransferase